MQGKEGNKTIWKKKNWPKNRTKKGNFLIIIVNQLDNLLKLVPIMNSWIPTPRLLLAPKNKYNVREKETPMQNGLQVGNKKNGGKKNENI